MTSAESDDLLICAVPFKTCKTGRYSALFEQQGLHLIRSLLTPIFSGKMEFDAGIFGRNG